MNRKERLQQNIQKAAKLRIANPYITLNGIGEELGISKQWAGKLLKMAGIHSKALRPQKLRRNLTFCSKCLIVKTIGSKLCKACWKEQHNIFLNCEYCNREIIVQKYYYHYRVLTNQNKIFFCNQYCYRGYQKDKRRRDATTSKRLRM